MFLEKVEDSLFLSQRVGNIYTGSLYACLYSLLFRNPSINDKKGILFSYGSGLCSTMLQVHILSNPLSEFQIKETSTFLENRTKVDVATYTSIMLQKEKSYGVFRGKVKLEDSLLNENVYYLSEVDDKWRRHYHKKTSGLQLVKNAISDN